MKFDFDDDDVIKMKKLKFDFDDDEIKMKKYLLNDKIFDSFDSAKKDYFAGKKYFEYIKKKIDGKDGDWIKIREYDTDYYYPDKDNNDSEIVGDTEEIRRQLIEAQRKQEEIQRQHDAELARRRAAEAEAKRKLAEAKAKAEEEAKTEAAIAQLVDVFQAKGET